MLNASNKWLRGETFPFCCMMSGRRLVPSRVVAQAVCCSEEDGSEVAVFLPGFGWCVLLGAVPAFIAGSMRLVGVFNPQMNTPPLKLIVGDGSVSIARPTCQGTDGWSWSGVASLSSEDNPEDESYDYYQQ